MEWECDVRKLFCFLWGLHHVSSDPGQVSLRVLQTQLLTLCFHGHPTSVPPQGSSEVVMPPDSILSSAQSESDGVFCAQLQCFHFPILRHHDLHSWHAESCYEKSSFLCKRSKSL